LLYRILVIACLHCLLIASLSLIRLLTCKGSFDSAVFDQAFWMLLHTGVPTVTTQPPFEKLNGFGWHFSPVFYLLLPAYAILPSPLTLQIIQCLCLSFTVIPVALALREIRLDERLILTLVLLFLFNPFYFNAAVSDFHEVALACPVIATAYWALVRRSKSVFLLCLLLLVLTKEEFGICAAGFGVLWWWRHRDGSFSGIIALFGIACFVLILTLIMPLLLHNSHPMMGEGVIARYGWLNDGKNPFKILYALLFSDSAVIPGIAYLFALFFSVAFLPLLALIHLLPAAADIGAALLSTNPMPRSLLSYHSAAIIPVLIITAGIGIIFLEQRLKQKILPLLLFTVMALCGMMLYMPPGSIAIDAYDLLNPTTKIHSQTIQHIRSLVGDAPVCAQTNIAFTLSERVEIYPFPAHLERCDFIVLYLQHPYSDVNRNPFNTLYSETPHSHYQRIYTLLKTAPEWKILFWQDNWLVLGKKGTELPVRQEIINRLWPVTGKS